MKNGIMVISAVWCPSCLILKKSIKRIKEKYKDLEIKQLDYDLDEDEVKIYNIGDKLPVIISFKDNIEINRLIGEKKDNEIEDFLKDSKII